MINKALLLLLAALAFSGCSLGGTEWGTMAADSSPRKVNVQLQVIAIDTASTRLNTVKWFIIPETFEPDTSEPGKTLSAQKYQNDTIVTDLEFNTGFRLLGHDTIANTLSISTLFYTSINDTNINFGNLIMREPAVIKGRLTLADSTTGIEAKTYLKGTPCAAYSSQNGYFSIRMVPQGSYQLYIRNVISNRAIYQTGNIQSGDTINIGTIIGGNQ